MKWSLTALGATVCLLLCASEPRGQDLAITDLERSGHVTWTAPSLNVTCRVEWAASLAGPWYSSWTNQQVIFATNPSNRTQVPMFYRVVCEIPDPHFQDITAGQSLALLASRKGDPDFTVLDVRTQTEYDGIHITNAVNINYYSPTFAVDLDLLGKTNVYLIYCASGNRSGHAHNTMLGLGFHEVYNMLGGMTAFQNVPGADAYLEP